MGRTMTDSATGTVLPEGITSANGKLVYLYLETHGEASVGQLSEALGLGHMTLYSALRVLRERGIVSNRGERFRPAD